MADPGWVGAYGAAGGYDYLAKLIAERKKDEILAQKQMEAERDFALREWEAQQRAEQQRLTNERLFRGEERAEAKEARTELQQRAERLTENMPIGARLGLPQIATLAATDQQGLVGATPITQAPGLVERMGTAQAAPPTGPVTGGESIYTGTATQQHEQFKEALDQARYEATIARDEESKRRAEANAAAIQQRFDESQARLSSQFAAMYNKPQIAIVPMANAQGGTDLTVQNKRGLTPGTVLGQAPIPVGMQTQALGAEQGLGQLGEIARLYKKEYVGPVQGRLNETIGLSTGYDLTTGQRIAPELAQFANAVHQFKNLRIKLITGAAMNREEIPRIVGEVPDFSQPPEVFEANLKGQQQGMQILISRIRQRQAQGLPTPGIAPIGPDGAIRFTDGGATPGAAPSTVPGAGTATGSYDDILKQFGYGP